MNKIKLIRKLNDKDLRKIIETFDYYVECWNLENPEDCELQSIRRKIGLQECRIIRLKKWAQKQKEVKHIK